MFDYHIVVSLMKKLFQSVDGSHMMSLDSCTWKFLSHVVYVDDLHPEDTYKSV